MRKKYIFNQVIREPNFSKTNFIQGEIAFVSGGAGMLLKYIFLNTD
jgi:hypothetical protein